MKKTNKIIFLVVLTILLILSMSLTTYAKIDTSKLNQIGNIGSGTGALSQISGKILGVIYAVAVAVSIGMILVIGIKYMISSPDDKASLKARAVPYLIGAVLIFGTANIVRFIQKMSGWLS